LKKAIAITVRLKLERRGDWDADMNIADLIQWFETWANPAWQEKWDNCGWQIQPGILSEPARVLVCLTPTLAVMKEAIALTQQGIPVNLIFAHHPLIFSPLKSVCQGDPIGDMVQQAIAHRIGVYSAHTNFDQVADGTADVLAQLLYLKDTTPIEPTQDGLGYGRVGMLQRPLTLQHLVENIQLALNPPDLLVSPSADRQEVIERVAVLGGSGASYLSAVSRTGAQAYLTSDCKFHQFQEARDRNLILIDAGHYATERPACERLADKFQQMGVEWVKLSDRDEDFRQFGRIQS
jgi:dinuclear metal center YbgI/SA1388 family protein